MNLSSDTEDIILKLLDKSSKTRLGSNGYLEVLSHPFFAEIDTEKLLKKQLEAPYKPDTRVFHFL